nr:EAL domain-containing protein [Halomonas sp. Alg239-R46]
MAKRGYRLVLDDFGTGYSGLGYLDRYPLETVKIDKSFVSGPKASSLNASLVKTIVFMANHCGMKTIAEGDRHPRAGSVRARYRLHPRPGLPLQPSDLGGRHHCSDGPALAFPSGVLERERLGLGACPVRRQGVIPVSDHVLSWCMVEHCSCPLPRPRPTGVSGWLAFKTA